MARYRPRHAAGATSGRRWWWAIAGVVVLVVALSGVLVALGTDDDRTSTAAESTRVDNEASDRASDAGTSDEEDEADGSGGKRRGERERRPGRDGTAGAEPAEQDQQGAGAEGNEPTIGPNPQVQVTATFGGDILIHGSVADTARTGDGYDFSPMLDPVTEHLQAADLAVCHLEVTLGREGEAPTGYPVFRAPPHLAVDLAEAGFDGCSIASNHALDYGETGVVSTLDGMDAAGLRHTGTARSPEERNEPLLYDVGGLRIAHLSYSYGFNGFTTPAGKEWLANLIDPEQILAEAEAAREAGADAVVASLHWGNEYQHDIQPQQMAVAEALAARPGAVDIVIGHHAHVVQPISKVGDLWVVWGLGNMLSNNATSCCPVTTADGVLVSVDFSGTPGRGAAVSGVRFTPTWNERVGFRVLPAAATLAAPDVPPDLAAALRESYDRTVGHVLSAGGAELGVVPDPELPPG